MININNLSTVLNVTSLSNHIIKSARGGGGVVLEYQPDNNNINMVFALLKNTRMSLTIVGRPPKWDE